MPNSRIFTYLKPVLIGTGSGLAVLALVIGGLSLGGNPAPIKSQASESLTPSATPTASATSTLPPCSVADLASSSKLPNLQAMVVDSATKTVLYNKDENRAAATASTMKIITAAVALEQLGPKYTVTTRVKRDASDPSIIYFVGAGDPTLSRLPVGKKSIYKSHPRVSDLAKQVTAAIGDGTISKIVVDSSLFAGSQWLSSWDKAELSSGSSSPVSALQLDGARKDPTKQDSPRSTTPELDAGKVLASFIGDKAAGAAVVSGVTPSGASEIASVKSAPISSWVSNLIAVSDNTQAEALARLVSLDLGRDGSFSSIDAAYKSVMSTFGIETTGMKFMDGSGLSEFNAVAPASMVQMMAKVLEGKDSLNLITEALPVSGKSGTLAYRFKGDSKAAVGKVHAKTGWIQKGYNLVGYLDAKDGSKLLFAVYSTGKVSSGTPTAIDALVTGFYKCGLALSNN